MFCGRRYDINVDQDRATNTAALALLWAVGRCRKEHMVSQEKSICMAAVVPTTKREGELWTDDVTCQDAQDPF